MGAAGIRPSNLGRAMKRVLVVQPSLPLAARADLFSTTRFVREVREIVSDFR